MKREKLVELENWKGSPERKPLILRGARQVGKTWLMRKFGEMHYQKVAYFNFEKSTLLKNVFSSGLEVEKIILALQAESNINIEPENTLIIFDEIQAVPEALTALKYFQEDAPEFHIIAAGSLLGVALNKHVSFPVGKVDFLNLYPMNFTEFLSAMNEMKLLDLLEGNDWELIKLFKDKYITLLRYYYFVGGMPEAVKSFVLNGQFSEVRAIQNNILSAYENDFSKHAPTQIVPRIRMLWNAIPAQLAKENRKFIYGQIKTGARSKDYEMALSWLEDCGLVHKVCRISKPGMPLKAYEDMSAFKLFLLDTGLLSAVANIEASTLINSDSAFTEFKGAITEQFVLQQLISSDIHPFYWSAQRATAEVDFVVQIKDVICPIEVKAEENLQAKSLKVFSQKFSSACVVRTSLSDFIKQEMLINIPLYTINQLEKVLLSK